MRLYPITWQYIAGFFDGEGCISIYDYERKKTLKDKPNKPTYTYQEKLVKISLDQKIRFHVSMVQRETLVLEKIHQFLNKHKIKNSLYFSKKTDMGKVQFSSRKAVLSFLKQIHPYLYVKGEKAKFAIEFLEGKKKEVLPY